MLPSQLLSRRTCGELPTWFGSLRRVRARASLERRLQRRDAGVVSRMEVGAVETLAAHAGLRGGGKLGGLRSLPLPNSPCLAGLKPERARGDDAADRSEDFFRKIHGLLAHRRIDPDTYLEK